MTEQNLTGRTALVTEEFASGQAVRPLIAFPR
jgi:hypothetical protein